MPEGDARKEADEVGKGAYRQAGPKTGRQAAKTRQARADQHSEFWGAIKSEPTSSATEPSASKPEDGQASREDAAGQKQEDSQRTRFWPAGYVGLLAALRG